MKVLHVLRTGGDAYGVERSVLSILSALPKHGVDAHVVAVVETRPGGATGSAAQLLRQCGCPVDVIETGTRLPFGVARRLSGLCAANEPDIVHSHGYKCDVASLLSRSKAAKISTVHGWCSRTRREKFYEWVGVQSLKRMAGVIVLCEDYRQRLLRRRVPDRLIRVAHVGVDPDMLPSSGHDYRAEWGVGADDILAVQVGRLSPEKNPRLFVDAARRLGERFPHVKFALVGDGQLMPELLAGVAGLGGRVVLAGYVKEVADVLRAADIVINCATTEGLPGALLEAGSMSRPTVATAVGGVPEIIEDGVTGILCRSGDLEAMTAGIARLVEDAGLREKMGAAARERIRSLFNIDTCSKRLVEVYEEFLR